MYAHPISLLLIPSSNMESSIESRQEEHLLDDRSANLTDMAQDELVLTCQRPLEMSEYGPEDSASAGGSNIRYTTIEGDEPSEVSSILGSPTSTMIVEKEHTPNLSRGRTVLPPWTLRKVPLLGFIAFLITLVVVLETLYFISNRYQGLTTSGKDYYLLWKYCPTASKL